MYRVRHGTDVALTTVLRYVVKYDGKVRIAMKP